MEHAGDDETPEDAERRGIGTPATRAGIIERLIKTGSVERRQKQLILTEKGQSIITVLPDVIKSPLLTSEWETRLKLVEAGEMTAEAFMSGIIDLVKNLVTEHNAPVDEYRALFRQNAEIIGVCPRCKGNITESKRGFFCDNPGCKFALWRDNRFFAAKKKEITKEITAALLNEGRVSMSGLFSEKTGKKHDAAIILDDTGEYVNFKLEFLS